MQTAIQRDADCVVEHERRLDVLVGERRHLLLAEEVLEEGTGYSSRLTQLTQVYLSSQLSRKIFFGDLYLSFCLSRMCVWAK
jgi:hypothetical protein